jgi:hypothetical protein
LKFSHNQDAESIKLSVAAFIKKFGVRNPLWSVIDSKGPRKLLIFTHPKIQNEIRAYIPKIIEDAGRRQLSESTGA